MSMCSRRHKTLHPHAKVTVKFTGIFIAEKIQFFSETFTYVFLFVLCIILLRLIAPSPFDNSVSYVTILASPGYCVVIVWLWSEAFVNIIYNKQVRNESP